MVEIISEDDFLVTKTRPYMLSSDPQQVPAVPMMYAPQMYGGVQTVMMPQYQYQYPPMVAPVGAPVGGK